MPAVNDLISDEYLDQLHKMRAENHRPRWGNGGQRHKDVVLRLIAEYKASTVLDYGCGLGMLLAELAKSTKAELHGYDPGIQERAALPAPADLVISTDVLEHIEPDKLNGVLAHIRSLTGKAAYLHIHTGPANAILPDGRNAHLIQKPAEWWEAKLLEYFSSVTEVRSTNPGSARLGSHIFGGHRPTYVCLP